MEMHRQLYTLRWSLRELLSGQKKLAGHARCVSTETRHCAADFHIFTFGDSACCHKCCECGVDVLLMCRRRIRLHTAISQVQSVIKVDVWTQILDDFGHLKYIEMTNFFILKYTLPGTVVDGSDDSSHLAEKFISLPFQKGYFEALADDMHKYQDPTQRNSLKVAKRMWMKAVMSEDEPTLRLLFPLFSSPAAALSQVAAECETLQLLVTATGNRQGVLMGPLFDAVLHQVGWKLAQAAHLGVAASPTALGYLF